MFDLPKHSLHKGEGAPCCPWCGQDMGDLAVRFDTIEVCHDEADRLNHYLMARGHCPACARPVRVTELRGPGFMNGKAEPERTDKDRQFLREVWGESG